VDLSQERVEFLHPPGFFIRAKERHCRRERVIKCWYALAIMSINAWTDAIMTKLFHRQPRSCRTAPKPELESPAQVRSNRTPLPVFRVRPQVKITRFGLSRTVSNALRI